MGSSENAAKYEGTEYTQEFLNKLTDEPTDQNTVIVRRGVLGAWMALLPTNPGYINILTLVSDCSREIWSNPGSNRDWSLIKHSMDSFFRGTSTIWSPDCLRAQMLLPADLHDASDQAKKKLIEQTRGTHRQSPNLHGNDSRVHCHYSGKQIIELLRAYNQIYFDFNVKNWDDIYNNNNENNNINNNNDNNSNNNNNENIIDKKCLTYNRERARMREQDKKNVILQATQSTSFLQNETPMYQYKYLNKIIDNFENEMNKQQSQSQQINSDAFGILRSYLVNEPIKICTSIDVAYDLNWQEYFSLNKRIAVRKIFIDVCNLSNFMISFCT